MSFLKTAASMKRTATASVPGKQVAQGISVRRVDYLVPALAGCMMLVASVLPWLKDPLAGDLSAWQLPVNIGWHMQNSLLTYGLLCMCGALLAFGIAVAQWRSRPGRLSLWRVHLRAGWMCLVPILLLLWQYLFVDIHTIDALAQHQMQVLLIQQHFGYNTFSLLIPMRPFDVSTSTLFGRFELLINQLSFGVLLPCASGWLFIAYKRLFGVPVERPVAKKSGRSILVVVLLLACAIVLGRAPTAMICNYEAKISLAAGSYADALRWLDSAYILNPQLDQLPSYHEERGQALYFLHPDDRTDNTRAYLAMVYRGQKDYVDAYNELLVGWQRGPMPDWMVDEVSNTLEMQAEYVQSTTTSPLNQANSDVPALPWLEILLQVNSSNLYAQYVEGRIQYDLHNYPACTTYMRNVLFLSQNPALQSSAYTYMGLSAEGQRNYIDARRMLLKAIELDPNYNNNIAREELSGLH
ncbi:MAG: tetratricopeptide repeat protein [Ktedonobacteraceae bacterium]